MTANDANDIGFEEYVRQLTELSKAGLDDPLLEKLSDRLQGGGPILMPGEGDCLDILILVYRGVRNEGEEKAVRRLRKAASDLLLEALRQGAQADPDGAAQALRFIDEAGYMVAWFELRQDPVLSADLADRMLGFLNGRIGVPFKEMMGIERYATRETAVRAFDLWLAATPWEYFRPVKSYVADPLMKLHQENLKTMRKVRRDDDTRLRLLFLSFTAVLRSDPCCCGSTAFPELMEALDDLSRHSGKFRDGWFGTAREIRILFRRYPWWREKFVEGIDEMESRYVSFFEKARKPELTAKALRLMGLPERLAQKLRLEKPEKPEERIDALFYKGIVDRKKVLPFKKAS